MDCALEWLAPRKAKFNPAANQTTTWLIVYMTSFPPGS